MANPYLGDIRMFGGTYAPQGWAFCNGATLAIEQYPQLYALLGTTYGGDGTTTFGLPNLLGRVPIHANGSSYTLGQSGGSETVTLTTPQMPTHNHQLAATTTSANTGNPSGALLATADPSNQMYRTTTSAPSQQMAAAAIGSAGGGAAHANVMPFQAVNYIIAIEGTYPTQS